MSFHLIDVRNDSMHTQGIVYRQFFESLLTIKMLAAAILMRGEPFRWGIHTEALKNQKKVYESIDNHVIKPLRTIYNFTYFMGVDRRRKYSPNVYALLDEYAKKETTVFLEVNTTSQVTNFKEIVSQLSFFLLHQFDKLFVFRHDITVTKSVLHWGCDLNSSKILLPGYIKQRELIDDIYMIMPRQYFNYIHRILFNDKYPCWAGNMTGWQVSTGHFCHKVFDHFNISYSSCSKTKRVRHHSNNYTTHELSSCSSLPKQTTAWRCGR